MIGQPYVVAGRTYVPRPGRGYKREGWASWYGSAFHGRLTANGEIFDRESIAAAHPTLPLPSYVRITNVVNGRSIVVRVNDRGPYERERVIDVSERVALALDFHRRGTGRVRVEYLGKASLSGSDDRKLLATLRTDGGPAGLPARDPPVMVAAVSDRRGDRDAARMPSSPPVPPVRTARRPLPEYAEEASPTLRRPGGRATMASTMGDRAPLDLRPPSRPDLAGVY